MRFFQSIRWQLQFWHGLLLVLVLTGFGFTAWRLQRARQLEEVDAGLELRASAVEAAILRGATTPGPTHLPPERVALTAPERKLFESAAGTACYFVLWWSDHREIARSAAAPADIPRPERAASASRWRWRGRFRERFEFAPRGECILVGQDMREEFAACWRFAWLLAAAGGGVLALGLAGDRWIALRALRPIQAISATATRIATGDLTQRIGIPDTANELGQLVSVLNTTFSRLDDAFTRQARFTSDAAHELRTPVTVILMHTQNGLASEGLSDGSRKALAASQRAAQRMRRLTESLLTLARLDSAKSAAARRSCDLSQITREAVEILRPFAQAQELDLTVALAPAHCEANAEQLGQVVTNLVSNAIHYNRPGGRVTVKVAAEGDAAVLVVTDTGEGIGPEDLPHIFERFYRADKARSSAAGRVGLGLAITQAIVQAHGGSLEATSELGQGSVFTVRLPAAASPMENPKTENRKPKEGRNPKTAQ